MTDRRLFAYFIAIVIDSAIIINQILPLLIRDVDIQAMTSESTIYVMRNTCTNIVGLTIREAVLYEVSPHE